MSLHAGGEGWNNIRERLYNCQPPHPPPLPPHQTNKKETKTTAVRMHLTMQQLVISLVCLTVASSSLGKSTDLSDYQQVRCLLFIIYRHKILSFNKACKHRTPPSPLPALQGVERLERGCGKRTHTRRQQKNSVPLLIQDISYPLVIIQIWLVKMIPS
jgi:hypothetical protein